MLILAIETTGRLASVALTDGMNTREVVNESACSHLCETVPLIERIMGENAVGATDLSAVALSIGPGSFTGVRIGAATVKALASIWRKPVIAVPTLMSFAYTEAGIPEGEFIAPVFDARRSQIYAAAYGLDAEGKVFEAVPGAAYNPDDFLEALRFAMDRSGAGGAIFCGDGCLPYSAVLPRLGRSYRFAEEAFMLQRAGNAARLAAEMHRRGDFTDPYSLEPEYMRLPEAERKLAERLEKDGKDAKGGQESGL